jgi:hypothetical protein
VVAKRVEPAIKALPLAEGLFILLPSQSRHVALRPQPPTLQDERKLHLHFIASSRSFGTLLSAIRKQALNIRSSRHIGIKALAVEIDRVSQNGKASVVCKVSLFSVSVI